MPNQTQKIVCLSALIALTVSFFALDLAMPLGVAGGIPYIIIIALCIISRSIKLVVAFTIICVALITIGYFLSPPGGTPWIVTTNRVKAILAVLLLASIGIWFLKQLEFLEAKLRHNASTDDLTAISNRRHIELLLDTSFQQSSRYQSSLSLLLFDVDHFKQVNDNFGHTVGDEVLKRIAEASKQTIRDTDYLGRYGGEEFLIIGTQSDKKGAIRMGERLRSAIEEIDFSGVADGLEVTISVGCTSRVPTAKDTVKKVIDTADKALYQAKNNGRNRTEYL